MADRASHLREYGFRPGQSGNPGGRPRTAALSRAYRADLVGELLNPSRDEATERLEIDAMRQFEEHPVKSINPLLAVSWMVPGQGIESSRRVNRADF